MTLPQMGGEFFRSAFACLSICYVHVRPIHKSSDNLLPHQASFNNACRGYLLTEDFNKVNPSQKPLLQLEFLLRVCHQGGWLVDLCCGSGSGLIAGLRLGYNVAGFDIREAQVKAARARIKSFADQEVRCYYLHAFICIILRPNPCEQPVDTSPPNATLNPVAANASEQDC